jgi:nucleoside-diphosphate-sugar epimerase
MMMMICILSLTGFVGMHVLKQLLEADYVVRVVTRSADKVEALKKTFSQHQNAIEVAMVKDQLAEGAYDEATNGVDAVVHIASPFTFAVEDVDKDLVQPAIKMATNMLEAANKSKSVKRVVLTSSLAAIVDPFKGGLFADVTYTSESWNPITKEQIEGPILGYLGSKKLAEEAAWKFVEEKKPGFDLVTHCPSLVVGEPLQHVSSMDKLNTSCQSIYSLFDAKSIPDNQFPFVVDVVDVARAHVQSLKVAEAGSKRFILSGSQYSFQLIVDAIRKEYPQLQSRMITGNVGEDENKGKTIARLDVSPAEKILGIKFANWHDTIIRDTVPALLELEARLSKA